MPRAIRLKEFPRSSEIIRTPPDWYVTGCDSSLTQQDFKLVTDCNGFITPEPAARASVPIIIFLGDSVVEGMFAPPEDRLCSRLQDVLSAEHNIHVSILNAGYGGASVLHSFNTFLNKLVPLQPAAVVLMTGMVDIDVAMLKASFWTDDCWLEPIIELGETNNWRDPVKREKPSFEDQSRVLTMLVVASRLFSVPLWFATTPHRQVFGGEYCTKTGKSPPDFQREVRLRCGVNDAMREIAKREGVPLFDLETRLADRTDLFYDMFHLNGLGGEVVARTLIKGGFTAALRLLHIVPEGSAEGE